MPIFVREYAATICALAWDPPHPKNTAPKTISIELNIIHIEFARFLLPATHLNNIQNRNVTVVVGLV